MLTYKIIRDSGTPCEIQAATRGEAVARFCAETGMPLDYFKRHCTVKTLGHAVDARRRTLYHGERE